MVISLESGRTFDVRFCHSSHDGSMNTVTSNNHGLRYYADQLAYSTRRRVTLCELSELYVDTEVYDEREKTVVTPIATGVSLCHYTDQFSKLRGRSLSLKRAIRSAEKQGRLTRNESNFIWDQFPSEEEHLLDSESDSSWDKFSQ